MLYQSDGDAATKMAKIGYNDEKGTRCLDYRCMAGGVADAMGAVEVINAYNNFQADKVNDAIRKLVSKRESVNISIGREGSPVIYIYDYGFSAKQDLLADVKEAFSASLYDELGTHNDVVGQAVRIWWD